MAPQLQPYDEEWLDEYRAALEEKYQGRFQRLFTFSQEESRIIIPDYTVNAVVIIKDGDRQTIKEVERLGFSLCPLSEVIPLIWVYTEEEWERRKQKDYFPFVLSAAME